MSFYQNMADTAYKMLALKGQSLTFSRRESTSFDPILGKDDTADVLAAIGQGTQFTVVGAAFSYKTREVDGVHVQTGDIRLIVNAMTTPPIISDHVSIDGDLYRVMRVESINPAGTPVIYKLQLRK